MKFIRPTVLVINTRTYIVCSYTRSIDHCSSSESSVFTWIDIDTGCYNDTVVEGSPSHG